MGAVCACEQSAETTWFIMRQKAAEKERKRKSKEKRGRCKTWCKWKQQHGVNARAGPCCRCVYALPPKAMTSASPGSIFSNAGAPSFFSWWLSVSNPKPSKKGAPVHAPRSNIGGLIQIAVIALPFPLNYTLVYIFFLFIYGFIPSRHRNYFDCEVQKKAFHAAADSWSEVMHEFCLESNRWSGAQCRRLTSESWVMPVLISPLSRCLLVDLKSGW